MWVKILIVVMLLSGCLSIAQIYVLWQWDHLVAPYCWNPYMVVDDEIKPSDFFKAIYNDWISWLPPTGWKTGVYCYNFCMMLKILLPIIQFLAPPLVVMWLRKKGLMVDT